MTNAAFIAVDWQVAAHLVAAIDRHVDLCRNGPRRIPVPAELDDLRGHLAATGSHGRTSVSATSPDLVSCKEAARRLGVSVKTVRRRVAAGELRSVRVGRLVRIAEVELEDYIRNGANR